jgi:YaaC-like Protein
LLPIRACNLRPKGAAEFWKAGEPGAVRSLFSCVAFHHIDQGERGPQSFALSFSVHVAATWSSTCKSTLSMHIWTDTPLIEIWNQLRYLCAPANVAAVLSAKVASGRAAMWQDDGALQGRSYEIACCIRQADEYFTASHHVGLATRPLLQFYGVQSLAKAAILAADNNLRLSDIRYHGLSTRPSAGHKSEQQSLQSYADDPNEWTLEREFAVTNDGVFPHIARIAGDPEPSKGQVIRFKELLAIIPDMASLYARHYGQSPHCIYLYSGPEIGADGHYQVVFSNARMDQILDVFPQFHVGYDQITCHSQHGFRSKAVATTDPEGIKVQQGAVAGRYAVRPHATGVYSALPVLYAASFVLSNVVRYKPAFWMDVVEGRATGSSALAEAMCNVVERHFPNQTLESVWQEQFTYGGPSYVT